MGVLKVVCWMWKGGCELVAVKDDGVKDDAVEMDAFKSPVPITLGIALFIRSVDKF